MGNLTIKRFKIIPDVRNFFLRFYYPYWSRQHSNYCLFLYNQNLQLLDYKLKAFSRFEFTNIDKDQYIFNFQKRDDVLS